MQDLRVFNFIIYLILAGYEAELQVIRRNRGLTSLCRRVVVRNLFLGRGLSVGLQKSLHWLRCAEPRPFGTAATRARAGGDGGLCRDAVQLG